MRHIFEAATLKSERKIGLDGIRTLWIKTSSQDICFYKGKQELKVKEYLGSRMEPASAKMKGDALCLEISMDGIQLMGNAVNEKIELYVPESFNGQIYAESASGDISIGGQWNLENVQMVTASGDICAGRLFAQHFLVKSKSGDISIEEANGDRQFQTISGDLDIRSGDGNTNAETISGDLQIAHINGLTIVKTVSGDMNVSFKKVEGNTSFSSVSGDIRIRCGDACQCALDVSTKSGDINVMPQISKYINRQNHHVTALIGCNNEKQVETYLSVSSTSGDIVVSN